MAKLATYNRRLDFERGADVNPGVMLDFLKTVERKFHLPGIAKPQEFGRLIF